MTGGPGRPAWRHDEEERRIAARITERSPGWLVLWSISLRCYSAYPRFDVPPGTVVTAVRPRELLTLMRQVELAPGPGAASSGPDRGGRPYA